MRQTFLQINLFFNVFCETARKNGENTILDEVSPVATFRVRTIDKLDEACTNTDDRMMLVRHHSSDCVMS